MWTRLLSRRWFRGSQPLFAKKDYYKILGVQQGASEAEIKKAYFNLAKQFHPDVNKAPGAKEKFAEINDAYQTIGNAEKRKMYDSTGMTGDEQDQAKAGFGGQGFDFTGFNPFGFGGQQSGPRGFGFGSFQDILNEFEEMFGNRQEEKSYRGEDITATVEIEFLEAVHGTKKTVTVQRKTPCPACRGTKMKSGSSSTKCNACGGRGRVYMKSGPITFESTCSKCHGHGFINKHDCPACKGIGSAVTTVEEITTIPKGVDTGQMLRMANKGHVSESGGPSGDLLLKVKVKSHPIFKREGLNILSSAFLTVAQAVLGTTIDVETVDGTRNIRIEPGVAAGSAKVLAGLGVSQPQSPNRRGDHIVKLHVQVPKRLNAKQRQIYEALQAEGM